MKLQQIKRKSTGEEKNSSELWKNDKDLWSSTKLLDTIIIGINTCNKMQWSVYFIHALKYIDNIGHPGSRHYLNTLHEYRSATCMLYWDWNAVLTTCLIITRKLLRRDHTGSISCRWLLQGGYWRILQTLMHSDATACLY